MNETSERKTVEKDEEVEAVDDDTADLCARIYSLSLQSAVEKRQIIISSFFRVGEWMTWEQTSEGRLLRREGMRKRKHERELSSSIASTQFFLFIHAAIFIFNVSHWIFHFVAHKRALIVYDVHQPSGWNGKSIFDGLANNMSEWVDALGTSESQ